MLFGRKTPPAAPKADSATPPAGRSPGGETGNTLSPLASLTNPPPPAAAPNPASTMAPSMAQALAGALPADGASARPAFSDTPSPKGTDMTNTTKPPAAPTPSGAGFKTDVPRRVVDMPASAPRVPATPITPPAAPVVEPAPVVAAAPLAPPAPEQRRLTVGRDISLSGEIGSCDVLVVEGTVEAKLREGRSIEIADTGLFKGSVEIDEADIGGRFEGDLIVRGRLIVRSTGRITGSITFGELSVDVGGQLVGDIKLYAAPGKAAQASAAPASAAAPVPAEAL